MTPSQARTLFILSDGTGETAVTMVRAALVQYQDQEVNLMRFKNIRREEQVESILEDAAQVKAFLIFTVASPALRRHIQESCTVAKIPFFDLLGPLLDSFDLFMGGRTHPPEAGLLRTVNESYFKKIEAIEFTVKHDDGKEVRDLNQADIVLVGISRTSKTPLSVFLSHKGWKVANIPLVLNVPPPQQLFEVDQRKIIALTIDPEKLGIIRKKRVEKFGDTAGDYATTQHVLAEIEQAERLYSQNKKWPVFNVTERALEETATEITRIICSRFGRKEDFNL